MNYQAIRAVFESPLLSTFGAQVPPIPVYFDNITNSGSDSVDEYVTVNIQFGVTNEPTLTTSVDNARGIVVIRVFTPKGKGPGRNQQLVTLAVNALETINAAPKPATGVYARTGSIDGPSFGVGSSDQESRRAFTPFFISRVETDFQATVLS
jgi:hypothetical protein